MTEVERTAYFPVGAAELWEALTDPALLTEWFGTGANGEDVFDIDLRPGGTMHFGIDGCADDRNDCTRTAVIDEIEPGHRLSFTWSDDDDAPGSRVEIEVVELGDGESELRVRELLLDEIEPPVSEPQVERFPFGFAPPRTLARA
jgi:uncharacterized protein YndB with AHSA1/START domain